MQPKGIRNDSQLVRPSEKTNFFGMLEFWCPCFWFFQALFATFVGSSAQGHPFAWLFFRAQDVPTQTEEAGLSDDRCPIFLTTSRPWSLH